MAEKDWGVFLCTCKGGSAIDPTQLEKLAPLVVADEHSKKAVRRFARQLQKAELERVLIACDTASAHFAEALGARTLRFLALGQKCFRVHGQRKQAYDKARRMIRAAMRAGEKEQRLKENLLEAGGRLLIWTDCSAGLELARQVREMREIVIWLSPDTKDVERISLRRRVNLGGLLKVQGRLGAFAVHLAPLVSNGQPPAAPLVQHADQVVVLAAGEPPALIQRTGLYLEGSPEPNRLSELAGEIDGLKGLFGKPEHVAYDPALCAGGAADLQTCGLCLSACPYQVIAREGKNPLRIQVDHLGCEGCGACVSACPTSALTYTRPSPPELYGELEALLSRPGRSKLIVFHCPEMGERILREASAKGLSYPPAVLPVEVPCLRYVSETNMLMAIGQGAAGVALLGCQDCPHGERALLHEKINLTTGILKAFERDGGQIALITAAEGEEAQAITALGDHAGKCKDALPPALGARPRRLDNRTMLSHALAGLMEATAKQPGPLALSPEQPYAFVQVREEGCTLCRACANVCPTHAFKFEEEAQELHYKHIDCVGCGLCAQVCPEEVISLQRELHLDAAGLDYALVAADEMITCARCERPYINRRALERIEAKVLGLEALLDTFAGKRKHLLRMCPDCRAATAMWEVNQGWEP